MPFFAGGVTTPQAEDTTVPEPAAPTASEETVTPPVAAEEETKDLAVESKEEASAAGQ
jgi:hypothetical protein